MCSILAQPLFEGTVHCPWPVRLPAVCRGRAGAGAAGKTASSRVLNFKDRLKAALGAAQGLAFLHEGCGRRIIYRDFKTSNILVDRVSSG